MSLTQRMHFLEDVFQMTGIVLVSGINHFHINGLHLFWDTLYLCEKKKVIAQLPGVVEYSNCISAEGYDQPLNYCLWYDTNLSECGVLIILPVLTGPPWSGVAVHDRVPSLGKIPFEYLISANKWVMLSRNFSVE